MATCLDQARQVASQGADVLSSDEVSQLERNAGKLKTRYERSCDRSDKLLKRLLAAEEELNKFRYVVSNRCCDEIKILNVVMM